MIKRKRKEKKLTLKQIANKLFISESYINMLENHPEKCNPTINLILKLSEILDLSPYFVFRYFIEHRNKD